MIHTAERKPPVISNQAVIAASILSDPVQTIASRPSTIRPCQQFVCFGKS